MSDNIEPRIESLITAQALPCASEDLRQRVHNLATFHAASGPQQRASAIRYRFAAIAATTAVGLAGLLILAPSLTAANTLNVLAAAMDGATTMHLKMLDVTNGTPMLAHEAWYLNGASRFQDSRGYIAIWKSGVSYTYDPGSNTVIRQSAKDTLFEHGLHGFKMSQILSQMTGGSRGKNIQITKDGRPTYRVQFENSGVQERYIFTVDTKTDLPREIEVDTPKGGVWVKRDVGLFEFNINIPNGLFQPVFSATAKWIDEDAYEAQLAHEFQKPVAFLSNGSSTGGLRIRHIDATSRGHLFIVYSGSAMTMNRWLKLTDDRGVNYVRADMSSQGEFRDREFTVSGIGTLRVGWWVPENGHGSFHAGNYTLTLMKQKMISDPKPGEPRFTNIQKVAGTTFLVSTPSPGEVPLYLMITTGAQLPRSDLDARSGEAYSLYMSYMHRFVDKIGHPLEGYGMWDGGPTDGIMHHPKDLLKALQFANEELDLAREAAKQTGEGDLPRVYDHLFMINRLLGRIPESDDYLQKAEKLSEFEERNSKVWIEYQTRIGNIPTHPLIP
jgi:hypothetical protein